MNQETLLEFPCKFTMKIMGENNPAVDFADFVSQIIFKHAADFDKNSIQTKLSKNQNFVSLTCIIPATSKIQLDNLYSDLSKNPLIKMPYYFGMLEVLQALNIAMDLSDDVKNDNSSSEQSFNELVSVIRRIFEEKVDKIKIPVNNSEEKCSIHSKSTLTMQEKISIAEEEYSKFDKPDDMKMFSINLDYL